MKTINYTNSAEYRVKGSKFTGILFPAASVEQFEEHLKNIKADHTGARHHCYAYRIQPADPRAYSSDDGEPGGTAGPPILHQLQSFDIINGGLTVVRYFGGTKLGTSGLINAYGTCAQQCIANANLLPVIRTITLRITYPYSEQNTIDRLRHRFDLMELEAEYTARVTIRFGCPIGQSRDLLQKIGQLGHRNILYENLGEDYIIKK